MSQMSTGLGREETKVARTTRKPAAAPDPDEFLTDAQLAQILKVTTRTLQRWRRDGGGPNFVRIGEWCVRYRRADGEAWLASRTYAHRAAEAVA